VVIVVFFQRTCGVSHRIVVIVCYSPFQGWMLVCPSKHHRDVGSFSSGRKFKKCATVFAATEISKNIVGVTPKIAPNYKNYIRCRQCLSPN
jgi:hypothetical protein